MQIVFLHQALTKETFFVAAIKGDTATLGLFKYLSSFDVNCEMVCRRVFPFINFIAVSGIEHAGIKLIYFQMSGISSYHI